LISQSDFLEVSKCIKSSFIGIFHSHQRSSKLSTFDKHLIMSDILWLVGTCKKDNIFPPILKAYVEKGSSIKSLVLVVIR
jgi:hypothetical protein